MRFQQRPAHRELREPAVEAHVVSAEVKPDDIARQIDPGRAGLCQAVAKPGKEPAKNLFSLLVQRVKVAALRHSLAILGLHWQGVALDQCHTREVIA